MELVWVAAGVVLERQDRGRQLGALGRKAGALPAHWPTSNYTVHLQTKDQDMKGHEMEVNDLSWSPQSDGVLATGSADHTVKARRPSHGRRFTCTAAVGSAGWQVHDDHHGGRADHQPGLAPGRPADCRRQHGPRPSQPLHTHRRSLERPAVLYRRARGEGCQEEAVRLRGPRSAAAAKLNARSSMRWRSTPPAICCCSPHQTVRAVTNYTSPYRAGTVEVLAWPTVKAAAEPLRAHKATCMTIDFDKSGRQAVRANRAEVMAGRYFCTGGGDATAALWDAEELVCVQTYSKNQWPVRRTSFSPGAALLAVASEDPAVEIVKRACMSRPASSAAVPRGDGRARALCQGTRRHVHRGVAPQAAAAGPLHSREGPRRPVWRRARVCCRS